MSEEGLPDWHDPLVLAALLHLLLTAESRRDEVTFADGELPALLGWNNTPSARREVLAAYCSTSYCLVGRVRRGPNQSVMRHSQVQQIIPEYEMSAERMKEGPGVTGEKKHFLGVDLERLPLEGAAEETRRRGESNAVSGVMPIKLG